MSLRGLNWICAQPGGRSRTGPGSLRRSQLMLDIVCVLGVSALFALVGLIGTVVEKL